MHHSPEPLSPSEQRESAVPAQASQVPARAVYGSRRAAREAAARAGLGIRDAAPVASAPAEDDLLAHALIALAPQATTNVPARTLAVPRRQAASRTTAAAPAAASAPRRGGARRLAAAGASVGIMGVVGLLALGIGAPAEAIAAAVGDKTKGFTQPSAAATKGVDIQAYAVSEEVDPSLDREAANYSTESFSQLAAASGITKHSDFFVNDQSAAIQWPFAVGVPITDGWGPRWGGFHHGTDFTPGIGAEIQSIAEGTVRIATDAGGVYGSYVVIDHEIDGQRVSTLYAHMLRGSIKVKVGDVIGVATPLGNTGDTGLSYGPHLHFEVTVGGTKVDPLKWLRTNTGG